jgi:hypothetical protein
MVATMKQESTALAPTVFVPTRRGEPITAQDVAERKV